MKRKIDIYAGLLGCGKTTLIRRLLQTEYTGRQVAIIENEIGRVNLDSLALSQADVTIREMTGGCVCCTIRGEFTSTVDLLVEQADPETIIIEPTGAADLGGIMEACQRAKKAKLHRVVMLVNARKLARLLEVVGEFYRGQIRLASCIYLNFAENMEPCDLQDVKRLLNEINPSAEILDTPMEQITAQTFARVSVSAKEFPVEKDLKRDSGLTVTDLNRTGAIQLRPRRKRPNLYTYTLQVRLPMSEEKYERLRTVLANETHLKLWRAKGLVQMESGEMRKVDLTFGDLFEEEFPGEIPESGRDGDALGQIVLIGPYIDREWLKGAF